MSPLLAVLRHPLVVGAMLALFSGIVATLLLPSLTRVWQDRPRELALKRELVTRIAREATTAIDGATVGQQADRRRDFYSGLIRRWRVESSIIASELTTYFPTSNARQAWRDYAGTISYFLQSVSFDGAQAALDEAGLLRDHFRRVRFEDSTSESMRLGFVRGEGRADPAERLLTISVLLLEERDEITNDIVESEAAGFSHGFWIFR